MKLRNVFFLLVAMLLNCVAVAQDGIYADYTEPTDGNTPDAATWTKLPEGLQVTWASRDVLYKQHEVPSIKMKSDTVVYAWRGERVGMEALIFSKGRVGGKYSLRATSETIESQARFVNYVLTDDFRGCGNHPTDRTPYLVPDVIDRETSKSIKARNVRPVWLSLEVPQDAAPGTHRVLLEILNGNAEVVHTLTLRVEVNERALPAPSDYAFNLNFWQQPYAASRYYGVKPWSDKHLEIMRVYGEMLARAGQKSVSAILFYEPWGVQSNDKFEPMVNTIKKADGTWEYDYTVFDKWVELMDSCGVNKQINCFSMVPWDMNFRYWDEAADDYGYLQAKTTDASYRELWTSFLVSFAAHLREKGWFEKTIIAMDERGLSDMQNAYKIAQEAVPGIKMSLAGNYHTELVDKMYDYCVAWGQEFTPEELLRRNEKGWVTTCYTACPDAEPNICSNNNPSDAAYLPIHAVSKGFNGFLRWAWMNWTDDPLRDTRFRMFTPGDTYIVYPGGRSGIRFERLIEGVQAAEKIRLLRDEYTRDGKAEALSKLNMAVSAYESGAVSEYSSSAWLVNYLQSVLNGAPEPPAEEVTDYCMVRLAEEKKDIALAKRWLASATTVGCEENLNYTSASPSATGYVVTDESIRVKRGASFSLNLVPAQNDDDLRWCRVGVFADWNTDSIFNTFDGELVERRGNAETENRDLLNSTFQVTVPGDAALGLSRLRICYADSWKPEPQPCGELYKGFAFDVPMEVVDDQTSISTTLLTGRWEGQTLRLSSPSNVFVYNLDGALLDSALATKAYSMTGFLGGSYVLLAIDAEGGKRAFKCVVR